jgi:hypothetical protein
MVFPTPTGPDEDHVLVLVQEVEGEDVLELPSVELNR